jgi:acylphosphatase
MTGSIPMAKRLRITGRVQGVGYRQWLCGEALALGLTGWVRNCRDGSVEATIDGLEPLVQALIERAHRGPPAAKVAAVSVMEEEGRFTSFEWRPSE